MSNLTFTCQICGKDFPADPDTMVESGMSGVCTNPDCDCHEDIPEDEILTADQLATMSDYALSEIGLTPTQRDELLATGEVTTGGMCICKPCQDAGQQA